MFRRSKADSTTAAPSRATVEKPHGKGRPTPTRREAEAAAKARAKAVKNPKAARIAARDARMTSSREIREGIKRGDEAYLGKRDRGPLRRFVRDYVDSRVNVAEFTIILLFVGLILSAAQQPAASATLLNATILIVFLDSSFMIWRMRRELRRRFPGESIKGTTFYALTRALQLRFMRIPKSRVKLGEKLPQHYH